jgi:hypothetical protein
MRTFSPRTRGCALLIAASVVALALQTTAQAEPHEHERASHEHYDARFNHNHTYPVHGYEVHDLPHQRVEVVHGGAHYYYYGGAWYAPHGPRFVVVAAPVGVFVPVLPAFYTTLWVAGLPYYYANDTYYVYRGADQGYEVVDAPDQGAVSTQDPGGDPPPPGATGGPGPAAAPDVFIYPKNGQSQEQQSRDRYECHRWASGETGFDPSEPGGGDGRGSRADYNRALTACLEGRGYSVK